jgi:hypothetical protein
MLRSHSVKNSATQMPASSSSAAMPAVPSPLPMMTACVEAPTRATAAMNTGRGSGRRSARTLPMTLPMPKQAMIVAQLDDPSSSRLANVGPRTKTAGSTKTW